MKRKYELINNHDNSYPPIKKRKTVNNINNNISDMSIIIQKFKDQEYKLNIIMERINNIDKRLTNVENFIEENKQPPKFKSSPSYFY